MVYPIIYRVSTIQGYVMMLIQDGPLPSYKLVYKPWKKNMNTIVMMYVDLTDVDVCYKLVYKPL